jgi:phenylacetate-CoA ligase
MTIMSKSFMPTIKTKKELADLQLKGLKWTVNHAYRGSPFYRKRLEDAGVKPTDIRSLKDLQKLPFTTSKDLQEGYPSLSFSSL